MSATTKTPWASVLVTFAPLAAAGTAGIGAGAATSWLQGVLPGDSNWLANSGAIWTLVAFAVALAVPRAAPAGASRVIYVIAAGTVALFGEVLGYYAIASPLRGVATTRAEQALWTAAALIVGPAAGWAAYLTRAGSSVARAMALGGVGGMIAGEGLHALLNVHAAAQGVVELSAGLVVAAVGSVPPASTGAARRCAAATAVGASVGLLVWVAYGR